MTEAAMASLDLLRGLCGYGADLAPTHRPDPDMAHLPDRHWAQDAEGRIMV